MGVLQGDESALGPVAGELPDWFLYAVPMIGLGLLVAVGLGAFGIWAALQHLRRIERQARRLDTLGEIQGALKHLTSGRGDLDLRRIEHALLEIRADQRRLHETMLQLLERGGAEGGAAPAAGLAERAVNRLVAMGYERVHVLTPAAELSEMEADGEIQVEARRHGALHKGRVLVRGGVVDEVAMQGPWAFFP